MKKLMIFVSLIFVFQSADAQRLNLRTKEIGLNMTPLLSQFIPFSNSSRKSGPFGLTFRTGRNDRYFNIQLGAQIFEGGQNDDYFNLAIGFLNKKSFSKKFKYYNSYNVLVSGGSFNEPTDNSGGDTGSIGLSYGIGLEYYLNDFMFLSVESQLFVGSTDDEIRIHLIPPVGLFLMVKLN